MNKIFGYYELLFNTLDRKIEPYQNREHQASTLIAMSVTFPDTKDFIDVMLEEKYISRRVTYF